MINEKVKILNDQYGFDIGEIKENGNSLYRHGNDIFLVANRSELGRIIYDRIIEDIYDIDNEILREFLPAKFHNELILDEYKELSKFDHTILSNSITDTDALVVMVLKSKSFLEILCAEQSVERGADGMYIYKF